LHINARMRIACALLWLAVSGAVAHADDAKPADTAADAHEAKPADAHTKVPLRVVRMLPETHQVLLFDKMKGTHVVVEAGQAVEGYVVDAIDADDVTLVSDRGATVVIEAPEPAWRHRRDVRTADASDDDGRPQRVRAADARTEDGRATDGGARNVRTASAPQTGEPQPADPYADVAEPSTIGTGADGVRVVEAPSVPAYGAAPTSAPAYGPAPTSAPAYGAAPASAPAYGAAPPTIGTGADGVRVVEAPNAPAPASPPSATPGPAPATATVPAPATVAVPAPATAAVAAPAAASSSADPTGADALAAALTGAPAASAPVASAANPAAPAVAAAPADGAIVLPRADVRAALGNFGTLAGSIHGAFTPTGVRVDSVATGSLFAKAGLRGGDVIASVDGVPLRSLDDAANLYARAASARNVSVAIMRAGKPVTLRVAIQ